MFAGLAPARRRLLLGLLAVVVAAVVAGTVALVTRPGAAAPVAQDRTGPVLLVPGYGGSTAGLEDLAGLIRATGRDVTVVPMPGNGTGDLTAAAGALGRAVTAARAHSGAAGIDVVGYSAGGVVARIFAADGGAHQLRRVVTLGSPQHGTELADLAGGVLPGECPAGCRQLGTGSDLLRRLNSGDETPSGPTWISLWTTQDQTVQPPDSARLAGALNIPVQSVCPDADVSHGTLPRDPLVEQMVLAELLAGPPQRLGPADCARLLAAAAEASSQR